MIQPKERQSIYDVALVTTGSVANFLDIMRDNKLKQPTDLHTKTLTISKSLPVSTGTISALESAPPATAKID